MMKALVRNLYNEEYKDDGVLPPPNQNFMITEGAGDFMVAETTLEFMITEG